MSLSTFYKNTAAILTTLATIGTFAYYWSSNEPPALEDGETDSLMTEEGWEILSPTQDEIQNEEKGTLQRIATLTDQVFPSYLEQTFIYPASLLQQHQVAEQSCRVAKFHFFDQPKEFSEDFTSSIIDKYMTGGHFNTKILNHDPEALQIAAIFKQLSEPLIQFAVSIQDDLLDINVRGEPHAIGCVNFFYRSGHDVVFHIEGDEISLTDPEGRFIGGYKSLRKVTIHYPTDENVICSVITRYIRL